MKKRIFGSLLALCLLANLIVPMAAFAEEYVTLIQDEEVTVTLEVGETKWYQFTPAITGTYSYVSYDEINVDPVADLYDSSMTMIMSNDDSEGSNFSVTATLNAGETYYLNVYEFNQDHDGSYKLIVKRSAPTDVFFDEYSVTTFVGTEYTVGAHIYPENADNTLTWTSSDETVASVDENGKVTFLAEGETTISAKTVNGLMDSCWFTVKPVRGALTLDKEVAVEYTVPVETRVDTEITFTFTPEETGYYCFYSYDIVSDLDVAIDPRVWVRDVLYNEIAYNDDGGEDVNISVEAAMTAGETYYITVELYDSQATGSYFATLKKMITADSVSVDCGDLVMDQGDYMDIYVTYSPAGSWQEEYVVTSSDPSVVSVEDKTLYAVAEGEATITVTTDLGLTDSIHVTVFGIDELELDTIYTMEGNGNDYGAVERYAFTPSVSGRYTISSGEAIGEGATVGVAISDAHDQLRYNNTGSDSFSLTYELAANQTYYYDISLNCEAEYSSVAFTVTKEDDAELPKANLNTDYDIDIINPSDGVYYVFKPYITGLYAIFSSPKEDIFDTKVYVYDSDWNLFYFNDDGADNSQYRLEEEFTAGETYYVKSTLYSNDQVGSHTMRIEPLFDLVIGDVNHDGIFDTADARKVLNVVLGKGGLTEGEQQIADMNQDGLINSADVRDMMLALIA